MKYSHQQLIAEYACAPQIHLLIVHAPSVISGAGSPICHMAFLLREGGEYRPAKVSNFQLSLALSLCKSPPSCSAQHVSSSINHGCALLVKSAALLKLLVELPMPGW